MLVLVFATMKAIVARLLAVVGFLTWTQSARPDRARIPSGKHEGRPP